MKYALNILVPLRDHLDSGIRTVHFHDPEGNLIEVNQHIGSQP
jgi:hypothetical protein